LQVVVVVDVVITLQAEELEVVVLVDY